jgi:hypothetical protein
MASGVAANAGNQGESMMKTTFAALVIAMLAGPAAAAETAPSAPVETPPAVDSVFEELAAFGYDLDKFRPPYSGRFPYR